MLRGLVNCCRPKTTATAVNNAIARYNHNLPPPQQLCLPLPKLPLPLLPPPPPTPPFRRTSGSGSRKTSIPKTLKIDVWNAHFGEATGAAPCPICSKKITQMTFQCCHIIADSKGGPTTLDNLIPGCDKCNQSMGNQNLNEFKARYYPS